ncbi:hypothetical protein B0H13DRAFT_1953401 [Mycena leptocephala]|nr:hypothetical protein B0H13DRAFT_1953401 [Mycena leptocephala]
MRTNAPSTLASTRVHLVSMVRFRETGKELSLPMTPHCYTPLKSSPLAQGFGPRQRVDPAPGRGRLQKCLSTNSTGTILQPRALLQRRLRLRLSQQLKAHGASIGQSNRAHGHHAGRKRIPLSTFTFEVPANPQPQQLENSLGSAALLIFVIQSDELMISAGKNGEKENRQIPFHNPLSGNPPRVRRKVAWVVTVIKGTSF